MTALSDVEVLRPTNLAEARDAMLDAGRQRPLLIRGAGTKLDWGAPARRHQMVLETTGLHRVLSHDPADATATVQAGMPLDTLQSQLAGSGQWLAIDPPHEHATVGGVFAANATGPRRLRYGAMRDLVIGMTMITADGVVARAGGKVIKNVAGYDLAKLLCGSLGTLGLVAELVVRLHPLPAASATVTAATSPALATQVTLALLASPLVVSAIDWSLPLVHGGDSQGTLAVRIEGRAAGVAEQSRGVADLLAARGADPEIVELDEEASVWRRFAEGHVGSPGETLAVAATLPSTFAALASVVDRVGAQLGADASLTSHLGNGLHTIRIAADDAAAHAAAVGDLRGRVEALGGHVTVRHRHAELTDPEVIWGSASAMDLMKAVKRQFDPGARCAPGRFVGGI